MKRYVQARGWVAYGGPCHKGKLSDLDEWLRECFFGRGGNADVVRQDLKRELSIEVSLRAVERAVAPYRQLLAAEAKATLRFETPPGGKLQIDFGETKVPIAGEPTRVFLFVATLGYSRRTFVKAFAHQRQSSWFSGIEAAFLHFGGVVNEVLVNNPKPLVVRPAPGQRSRPSRRHRARGRAADRSAWHRLDGGAGRRCGPHLVPVFRDIDDSRLVALAGDLGACRK